MRQRGGGNHSLCSWAQRPLGALLLGLSAFLVPPTTADLSAQAIGTPIDSAYGFAGLIPGEYVVDATDVDGMPVGHTLITTGDSDPDPRPDSVLIATASGRADFGYQPAAAGYWTRGLTHSPDPGSNRLLAANSIGGTVFEDQNYGGGAGRSLAASSGSPRSGVKVELYDGSWTFVDSVSTDGSGDYSFAVVDGAYNIRVVNSTVTSSRTGYVASLIPVQTFRTDASSGTAVPVTDKVGGELPEEIDAPANNGTQTIADLNALAGQEVESITRVNVSGSDVTEVDFGFNFSTIVNTNDTGQGSLRQFITNANALTDNASLNQAGLTAGAETSVFEIPTTDPNYSSSPLSYSVILSNILPAITDPVMLDGSTQPGYPGTPIIQIDGTSASAGDPNGLTLQAGSSTIRGLSIVNFADDAIEVEIAGGNTIVGNYIGLGAAGTVAAAAGNDYGLNVKTPNNTIGGTSSADRNVMSDNNNEGLYLGPGASSNVVLGNYIGTDATGTGAVGNQQEGIVIASGASNNVIGGAGSAGNVVANNGFQGIAIRSITSIGNSIRGNVSRDNGGLGIDLEGGTEDGNGVTDNDAGDGDSGPNNLQNYPVLTSAQSGGGTTTVQGSLNSSAWSTFYLDFYSNTTGGPSGHGDAVVYLGADTVTTDGGGNVNFTSVLPVSVVSGDSITATATISSQSTSEFSGNVEVVAVLPSLSSAANQTFWVGKAPTAVATLTVADTGSVTSITAADDIRIRIPAGFGMSWDTLDVAASIGGNASAKVSTTSSYEDGGKTLVLDVTSDFAIGDTITVADVSFRDFTTASAADSLELEINNDGVVSALDDKFVEILPRGTPTISSDEDQAFRVGDPKISISTITVQDDASAPAITAATDIRIRIPSGFNMSWDVTDVTATILGSGAAKVSSTVSYEDGGKTLVLDVTADFDPGDLVTVSALSFQNFTAESLDDNLELEVENDGMVTSYDDKVIFIVLYVPPLPAISSSSNQSFVVGDPSRRSRFFVISDDPTSAVITASNDIRVKIPSGLDMTWDVSDLSAWVFGRARTKVSNTVSYEDSGKTLVLNVTTDFADDDWIAVGFLKFNNFSSASAAHRLELEVYNDDVTQGVDSKTKTINGTTFNVDVWPDTILRAEPAGSNYTVDFTLTNTGSGTDSYDLLTSTSPGVVVSVVSMTGVGVSQGANPDSARVTGLSAGENVVVTVTFDVASVPPGTVDTLFFVGRSVASPTHFDDGRMELTAIAAADLEVTKTGPVSVNAGDTITYTVQVVNLGLDDAASVVITDTLPATGTFVSASDGGTESAGIVTWPTLGTMVANDTVIYTVDFEAPGSGSFPNAAAATAATADPDGANNQSSVLTWIGPIADLEVLKTGPSTAVAGDTLTYTVQVVNLGPLSAADVVITDTLPGTGSFVSASNGGAEAGGVVTWPTIAMATNDTVTYTVEFEATAAGVLTNIAAVSSTTTDTDATNNDGSAPNGRVTTTVTPSDADLVVTKTGPTSATSADLLVDTIEVVNAGPGSAGDVVIADTLPSGHAFASASDAGVYAGGVVTWPTVATLAAGDTLIRTVTYQIPGGGAVVNLATGLSSTTDPSPTSNLDSLAMTITGAESCVGVPGGSPVTYQACTETKLASSASDITLTSPVSTQIGDLLVATVVTENTTTLTPPAGWTQIDQGQSNGGSVTVGVWWRNAAVAGSQGYVFGFSTGRKAYGWMTRITGHDPTDPIDAWAALPQDGTTSPISPSVTTTVDSTLILRIGGFQEDDVNLDAPGLPGHSPITMDWGADKASGGAGHTGQGLAGATGTSNFTLTASKRSRTVTVAIKPAVADLEVTKTGPVTANAGDTVTYTIQVANLGDIAAQATLITDTLPGTGSFVSASDSGIESGGVVTWPTIVLAANDTVLYTIDFEVPGSGTLTNIAAATTGTGEDDINNNSDSWVFGVAVPIADLTVTKTGPGSVTADSVFTDTIQVVNTGPEDATNVVIADTLPPLAAFAGASDSGSESGGVVTWPTIATLAVNDTVTYTVSLQLPASGSGANLGTVAATSADSDPSSNLDSLSISVTGTSACVGVVGGSPVRFQACTETKVPSSASDITLTSPVSTQIGDLLVATVATESSITLTPPAGWTEIDQGQSTGGSVTVGVWWRNAAAAGSQGFVFGFSTGRKAYGWMTRITGHDPTDPIDVWAALPQDQTTSPISPSVTTTVDSTLILRIGGFQDVAVNLDAPGLSGHSPITMDWASDKVSGGAGHTGQGLAGATGTSNFTLTSSKRSRTVTVAIKPAVADLEVKKTGPASANAGDTVTYSVQAVNLGTNAANTATITDTLPLTGTFVAASNGGTESGGIVTWPSTTLAANDTVTYTVDFATPASGTLTNIGAAHSTTMDTDLTNNDGSGAGRVLTTVIEQADLDIVKSGPDSVNATDTVTYVITTTNNGPSDASAVVVADTLPAGMTFVSANRSAAESGGVVTWPALATLANGASQIDSVVVVAPASGPVVNIATALSGTADPDATSNLDSLSTIVVEQADLEVIKTGPASANAGDTVIYVITTTNNGPSNASSRWSWRTRCRQESPSSAQTVLRLRVPGS